jgi:hypothetical protein
MIGEYHAAVFNEYLTNPGEHAIFESFQIAILIATLSILQQLLSGTNIHGISNH